MGSTLAALKATCVKIAGPAPGTGYLVARDRIATCHHVIKGWQGAEYDVAIGWPTSETRKARVVASDDRTDCAILAFDPPVDGIEPLPLASELEIQTYWEGYGFPGLTKGAGHYLRGEVLDPDTADETGRKILQLFAAQAAAGQGAPLHGFSGTAVVVDGAVVGHLIRGIGDPDDAKRPAYGAISAATVKGVEALLGDVPVIKRVIRPARLAFPGGFVAELEAADGAKRGTTNGTLPSGTLLRSATILIGQNRPDLALQLLDANPVPTLQIQQKRAFALAKLDRTGEAIDLLKGLIRDGARDRETLGLLGGRYKDQWRSGKDDAALRKSYETYRSAYRKTKDPFNGINAAATALYCGEKATSKNLARRVRKQLESPRRKRPLDHWGLATLAEAWVLEGKVGRARDWYKKAVAKEPDLYHDIAIMRRQARVNLQHLGKDPNALDAVLPVPKVVAFAGHMVDAPDRPVPRFPNDSRKIGAIRLAIRAALDKLGAVQGIGTAAKGADILFLEELVRRRVRPMVIMPFPEEDFRRISMDEDWGKRFDAIRDELEIVILKPEAPPPNKLGEAFAESNRTIHRLAVAQATRLDEKARLLVVWDGKRTADGPGGTADVVKLWEEEGYTPTVIGV